MVYGRSWQTYIKLKFLRKAQTGVASILGVGLRARKILSHGHLLTSKVEVKIVTEDRMHYECS